MRPPGVTPSGRASPASGERRAVVRGVAWGGVESLTASLVGLVLTPLVVRTCGLAGLGLWAASWSLAHTTNLLDLGVGASYTRFTSQAIALSDTGKLNRTLAAGTGFHLVIGLLIAALGLLLGPAALGLVTPAGPLAGQTGPVLACTLCTVLLRSTLSAYRGVIAGAQRIDILGRIGAAAAVLEGIGAVAALGLGWSLSGMAVNSLVMGSGASLAEACVAHRLVHGLRVVPFRAGREEWRDLLSFGLRLQVVRAAEILGAHAPRLALAAGAGLAPAGMYDLGARVAGILQIAALPLPVLQPLAGRLAARAETERLRSLVARATRYVSLLAFSCAALVLLDAGGILKAWTGQDVPAAAATAARLLALALLCGFVLSPLRLVLRGCGQPGPEALAALAGAVLNVLLAIVLVRHFGAPGVAASALAGAILSAGILAIGARRTAPGLAGSAIRNLMPALASSITGLLAAVTLGLLLGRWDLSVTTRAEAIVRFLPEALLLAGVTLLVAFMTRALERDDLEAFATALLPARASDESGGARVLSAGGRP